MLSVCRSKKEKNQNKKEQIGEQSETVGKIQLTFETRLKKYKNVFVSGLPKPAKICARDTRAPSAAARRPYQ